MYRGSCLCGTVTYEVRGELGPIVLCHCRQCRKAQGGAFAANAPVRAADFRITAGRETIREYESSPGKYRAFCSTCGSPLISRRQGQPDTVRLRLGTLDSPVPARPGAHIYASSKAEWFEIHDDLPRYDTVEPGRRRDGGAPA